MPVRQLFRRTHKSDGKNHQRIEDKRRQIIDDDARRGRPETTASVFFEIRFVYRYRFCPAEACEHETHKPQRVEMFCGIQRHSARPFRRGISAFIRYDRMREFVQSKHQRYGEKFSPPAFYFTIYAL